MNNATHRIKRFLSDIVINRNSPEDEEITPDIWRRYFAETFQKLFQETKQTLEQILALENGSTRPASDVHTDHTVKNKLKDYSKRIIEAYEDSIYIRSVWEELIEESDDVMDFITAIYLLNSILTGESLQESLRLARVASRGRERDPARLTRDATKRARYMIARSRD